MRGEGQEARGKGQGARGKGQGARGKRQGARGKGSKFLFVCCLLFAVHCSMLYAHCFAGTVIEIDAERQFEFATRYFREGEHLKAIVEYERFLHFFPEDDRAEEAMYGIGVCHFESGRFEEAIKAFSSIVGRHDELKFRFSDVELQMSGFTLKAYFMISECHMKRNATEPAIAALRHLITLTDEGDVKDDAFYKIGWICLEMAEWERARSFFGKISLENREKYQLKRLSAELKKVGSISRKSPSLAGVLSIVPGAGHLYCERYHDALTAFLLNGLLMGAAYESFHKDHHALGALLTLVELGFHTGSIYGSISSAHKYNRTKIRGFIENLKQNTRIGLGGKDEGIFFCFRYTF